MRHHKTRHAQAVVQIAHQAGQHAQRNRILPGKRLVINHQLRIKSNRPGECHPPRHAAGQLRRHQRRRTAQTDALQLHQRYRLNQTAVKARLLAQRKSDILRHRHIRKQRAGLEQHAHPPPQPHQRRARQIRHRLAQHLDRPRIGPQLPDQKTHQRRLARAGWPHDGDHFAARNLKTHIIKNLATAACKRQMRDAHHPISSHQQPPRPAPAPPATRQG